MKRIAKVIFLLAACGPVWYMMMQLFFVWSGAQQVLASPAYQSDKFIKVFTQIAPLPRMATDKYFVLKGFCVCGIFVAAAFLIVNSQLNGSWLVRGLTFGLLQWLLMAPWFEFYLPYNVMHEPFPLVLLEGALWLATGLSLGMFLSFAINFKAAVVRLRT